MKLILSLISLTASISVAFAETKSFRGDVTTLMTGADCTQTAQMFEANLSSSTGVKVLQTVGTSEIANHSCKISFSYMADRQLTIKTDVYLFKNRDQCLQMSSLSEGRTLAKWGKAPLAYGCENNNNFAYRTQLSISVISDTDALMNDQQKRLSRLTPLEVQRVRMLLTKLGANNILIETPSTDQTEVNIYYLLPKSVAALQWGNDHNAYSSAYLEYPSTFSGETIQISSYADCIAEKPAMESYFNTVYTNMIYLSCVQSNDSVGYRSEYMTIGSLYSRTVPKKISTGLWEQVVPVAGEETMANCLAQKPAMKAKMESVTGKAVQFIFCSRVGANDHYAHVIAGAQ